MVKEYVDLGFGDTGKGRVLHEMTKDAQVVARCQGGANAGHTIYLKGKQVVFSLVPTGIIYPQTTCIMGNGMVIDLEKLIKEIENLKTFGIEVKGRLFISYEAHVVMPYHKEADKNAYIGTTGNGIGPCYEDKYGRRGIRMEDLLYSDVLYEKLERNKEKYPSLDPDKLGQLYLFFGQRFKPFIADTSVMLNEAIDQGKEVIIEGAQGLGLDIDHGTYPFVTSSHPSAGGACTGLGIGPTRIDEVIGIAKILMSRVGEGPLPTKLEVQPDTKQKKEMGETGSVTGRIRRLGWFDAVWTKRAMQINGVRQVILTKLDVLDTFPTIKICKGYRYQGKELDLNQIKFVSQEMFKKIEPIYEELEGWQEPTSICRYFSDLHPRAQKLLLRIQELLDCKIIMVTVGKHLGQTIWL